MSETKLPFSLEGTGFRMDDLDRFDLDDVEVETRGRVTTPYKGQSVWLAPVPTPSSIIEGATRVAQGGFKNLKEGIARIVIGHTMRDPRTGEFYPQYWDNPTGLDDVPAEAIYFMVTVITTGEVPKSRPNVSMSGRPGTSTRRSTARVTES